ncbi:MAG: DedA family protein [Xanthomonadales bacterium]|nr:DedA family protein [Xanthomonadales bacterium]NIN59129.1 DedA family protein [Xanthomonadales bacterium]NIN74440.1 DedA family protein [Xanthomonadales bacterium]NIO13243.1 DedA family protein [Xanthomonadales bacterium]NIP11522.1 DedA family protein [Xanthomonadales bacterium]
MFRRLYDRTLAWSAHRRAPAILAVVSAAESAVFPIPPDVMLAPMCLARPQRAWDFAALCTVSSVLGGMLGYLIGRLAFAWLEPWLMSSAYAGAFEAAVAGFERHGFWYILLAGFTPIPYKVFTVSAGVVGMPVLPFLAGSLVGRGARFGLVAGLIRLGGERLARNLRRWVDLLGWLVLLAALLVFVVLWFGGNGA